MANNSHPELTASRSKNFRTLVQCTLCNTLLCDHCSELCDSCHEGHKPECEGEPVPVEGFGPIYECWVDLRLARRNKSEFLTENTEI